MDFEILDFDRRIARFSDMEPDESMDYDTGMMMDIPYHKTLDREEYLMDELFSPILGIFYQLILYTAYTNDQNTLFDAYDYLFNLAKTKIK